MGKNDLAVIIPEKEIEKRISSLQAKLGECNQVRFLGHGIGLVIDEFPALRTRPKITSHFDAPIHPA